MSASLKISANTSEVKKSLLDLSRDVKSLGKSKISIFSESDRKFVKEELNKELSLMKTRLVENRAEIAKAVVEQTKLVKGSNEELEHRKKIIEAYRTQTKLASQAAQLEKQTKAMGGFGGLGGTTGGSGGLSGLLSNLAGPLTKVALAAVAYGATKVIQSGQQFSKGAGNRVRLSGLGMSSQDFASPESLARVGLTEQEFMSRQVTATSRLGREGGSKQSIMQQAGFERAFGLEGGTMENVSGGLRSTFGGKGADQAQMKLQASVFAAGIKDEIGPYLESATDLLKDINENGMSNTDEIIRAFAASTKDGGRTPEQLAAMFKGINAAVKGSTGEANAFLQTAFARKGIGGGTIGATRLAISSGGITGLSAEELQKKGYTADQIKSMDRMGLTSGGGKRSGAILDQFRSSSGVGNLGGAKGLNMVNLAAMGNSVFGTSGMGGFESIKLLEKLEHGQITQKEFDKQLKAVKEEGDPQLERLDAVNKTLAGQLTVQEAILENIMEGLGTHGGAQTKLTMTALDIMGTKAVGGVAGAVADVDVTKKTNIGDYGGHAGQGADYFTSRGTDQRQLDKDGAMPSSRRDYTTSDNKDPVVKAVEDLTKAVKDQKAPVVQSNSNLNVKVQNPNGQVTNKTYGNRSR